MIARRAVVSGSVQGVGFRFFAERAAREAGVTGWVRNEPDGSVQLEVQGPRQNVQGFLATLRNQMSAFIHRDHVEPISLVQGEREFEVQR